MVVLSIPLSQGQLSDIIKAKFYNRAVQCNFSEKFVFRNYSCFAKSYSRTISTVNVIATAKMPLYNIFVSSRNKFVFLIFFLSCSQSYFTNMA